MNLAMWCLFIGGGIVIVVAIVIDNLLNAKSSNKASLKNEIANLKADLEIKIKSYENQLRIDVIEYHNLNKNIKKYRETINNLKARCESSDSYNMVLTGKLGIMREETEHNNRTLKQALRTNSILITNAETKEMKKRMIQL